MLLSWPSIIRNYATPPTGGDWHNSCWLSRVFCAPSLGRRGPCSDAIWAPRAARGQEQSMQRRDLRPVLFDAAEWHAHPSTTPYPPVPPPVPTREDDVHRWQHVR
jgi:hypothetical protein